MDDLVHMRLTGKLAELLVATAPKMYHPYVIYGKRNEAMLYVQLKKALYGFLKSALLFYEKLVKDLKSVGFKLNPYDPCVANDTINWQQMTICWHVDDLKVSHVDHRQVTKMIKWIERCYGKMQVSRGKIHNYLGMVLDYSSRGR